jgi:homogentisate 1,2-dioxygenase
MKMMRDCGTMTPDETHKYLSGFGNEFATEARPDTLPVGQNNPQRCPQGLYAEQLSGAPFTVSPKDNQRTWLYRILPSVSHKPYKKNDLARHWQTHDQGCLNPLPDQLRWSPRPFPEDKVNFIDGVFTVAVAGNPGARFGCAAHVYAANAEMKDCCFYNADGDLLIVPEAGALLIQTEMGYLHVAPSEIAVIQRGIKFRVELPDGKGRGYICENFGNHFELPWRGPIGANGLANSRDFLTPAAHFDDSPTPMEMLTKFEGQFFTAELSASAFDVVAWHGNYAPFKYDLKRFNVINSVSFDHPDPSIFTVLTSPTDRQGAANIDFVIFPPRWTVAENTFRPPYFHRNIMSEFMGLIEGSYDAKSGTGEQGEGFDPGGASLHNPMAAHGPDLQAFEDATKASLKPNQIKEALAFMFETQWTLQPTKRALADATLQENYWRCWQGFKRQFE